MPICTVHIAMGEGYLLECGQPTRGHTLLEKWLFLPKASCQYVLSWGWNSWATLPPATVWLAWPCAGLEQAAMTDIGLWVHWPWNVPETLVLPPFFWKSHSYNFPIFCFYNWPWVFAEGLWYRHLICNWTLQKYCFFVPCLVVTWQHLLRWGLGAAWICGCRQEFREQFDKKLGRMSTWEWILQTSWGEVEWIYMVKLYFMHEILKKVFKLLFNFFKCSLELLHVPRSSRSSILYFSSL